MIPSLPTEVQRELMELGQRYGQPLVRTVDLPLEGYWNPRSGSLSGEAAADEAPDGKRAAPKPERLSEVCMVVRRPNGRLITGTKAFYPHRVFRLLTGGVEAGEGVLDALRRETLEETGLETEVRRFLAAVAYRFSAPPAMALAGTSAGGSQDRAHPIHTHPVRFCTFAFLLDEAGGTLGALDAAERLDEYREITPADLAQMAAGLATLDPTGSQPDPITAMEAGAWRDWGRFRSVIHHLVWEALQRDR
jgi:8-oxo-dGTP pyrophosphatase MutT (NUDIX family)